MEMKTMMMTVLLSLAICNRSQSQTTLESDSHKNFGKYYKIGDYDVYAPFGGQPHISPKRDNEMLTMVSYQYAYPERSMNVNFLYGIDIYTIKADSLFKTNQSRVDFVAGINKLTSETMKYGKVIKEEKDTFQENYCIRQKIKIRIPIGDEIYVNSIILQYENLIIGTYTYTPLENDDNNMIEEFFKSIRYR